MTLRSVVALAAALCAFDAANPHDWYDFKCCSERDCRQTTLGEVERHDDGWYVVPLNTTVPFTDERVRRSLDPLIHICLMPNWIGNVKDGEKIRCLYIPEFSG